jgi:hypothetical protein
MSLAVLIVGVKDIPGEVGKKDGNVWPQKESQHVKVENLSARFSAVKHFKRAVFRGEALTNP